MSAQRPLIPVPTQHAHTQSFASALSFGDPWHHESRRQNSTNRTLSTGNPPTQLRSRMAHERRRTTFPWSCCPLLLPAPRVLIRLPAALLPRRRARAAAASLPLVCPPRLVLSRKSWSIRRMWHNATLATTCLTPSRGCSLPPERPNRRTRTRTMRAEANQKAATLRIGVD